MEKLIGKTINKYLIIKQIGKGNFGTVFLSYNKNKKNLYALKIFEEKDEDNYLHETKLLHKLKNIKNIIHIIDNFKYNNLYIIVEELMMCSFDYLLENYYINGLPIKITNKLKNLTETIKEIHKKDILHGDIKPDNIFIKGLTFENKNLLNNLNNMNIKQFNIYSSNLLKNNIKYYVNEKDKNDDEYYDEEYDEEEYDEEEYEINTQSDISSKHNDEELNNFVLENLLEIIFNNDIINKQKEENIFNENKIIDDYKEENLLKYDFVIGDFDNSFIISKTNFNDIKDFQTRYYRDINIILRGNITPDCDLYAFNETLYELQHNKLRIKPHKSFGITTDKDNIKLLLENGLIINDTLKKSRKYHLFFDDNDFFLYNDYLIEK